MSSAASPACRFAKPSRIRFSTPPTMWYWWTCPPTICVSGSMREKSISAARPSGPSRTSFARATSSPCASWRCAVPPIGSMSRCAPGATVRARKKSGIPATPFCCASAITPAAKSWSAPPPGWRPGWGASGMRCMLKPPLCTACRRRNGGRFSPRSGWRRSWARKPPPSPILRKRRPSSTTPANIISAR